MLDLALARLLRLASPALPVGAFAYSQGLESAIAQGWIEGEAGIAGWIEDVLALSLARFEGPVLCRLYQAWEVADHGRIAHWNRIFLAARETAELRAESVQMGASLRSLLGATGEFTPSAFAALAGVTEPAFPTAFAFAASTWQIPLRAALLGYLFAWAENQVGAGIRSTRLGHVAAQRILGRVATLVPELADSAASLEDEALSNAMPGLAIASCLHETQPSRVFRS